MLVDELSSDVMRSLLIRWPAGALSATQAASFLARVAAHGRLIAKRDVDTRDVIRLEVDQERVGPVLRRGVNVEIHAGLVAFLLVIEADEPPAALRVLA